MSLFGLAASDKLIFSVAHQEHIDGCLIFLTVTLERVCVISIFILKCYQ